METRATAPAVGPNGNSAPELGGNVVEVMGPRIRRQRVRMAMTLDDLAAKTGISKPYLSLIETCRLPNPPRDAKLQRLEEVLGFPDGELVKQAHLHRTPKDVRATLQKLMKRKEISDEATKRQRGGVQGRVFPFCRFAAESFSC